MSGKSLTSVIVLILLLILAAAGIIWLAEDKTFMPQERSDDLESIDSATTDKVVIKENDQLKSAEATLVSFLESLYIEQDYHHALDLYDGSVDGHRLPAPYSDWNDFSKEKQTNQFRQLINSLNLSSNKDDQISEIKILSSNKLPDSEFQFLIQLIKANDRPLEITIVLDPERDFSWDEFIISVKLIGGEYVVIGSLPYQP